MTTPSHNTLARLPEAATVVLLRDGAASIETLLLERPDRGSFAGAWVFPGGKVEAGDARDDHDATLRAAAVRETAEETGMHLQAGDLVPLSRWTPPERMPVRIRTWFFLAADPGGGLVLQPDEAISARWLGPADALAAHGAGALVLYPPTWVTLHALTRVATVAEALANAADAGVQRFDTVAADGGLMLWQGDAEHPGEPTENGIHSLETATLPWRYRRTV